MATLQEAIDAASQKRSYSYYGDTYDPSDPEIDALDVLLDHPKLLAELTSDDAFALYSEATATNRPLAGTLLQDLFTAADVNNRKAGQK